MLKNTNDKDTRYYYRARKKQALINKLEFLYPTDLEGNRLLLLLLLLLPSYTASGIASSTNDSPTTDAEDVDKAEEDKAELLPFPSSLIPLY